MRAMGPLYFQGCLTEGIGKGLAGMAGSEHGF